jgi:hypothetical protein
MAKRKKSQPLPGLEPTIMQPVAQVYATELSSPSQWKIPFQQIFNVLARTLYEVKWGK